MFSYCSKQDPYEEVEFVSVQLGQWDIVPLGHKITQTRKEGVNANFLIQDAHSEGGEKEAIHRKPTAILKYAGEKRHSWSQNLCQNEESSLSYSNSSAEKSEGQHKKGVWWSSSSDDGEQADNEEILQRKTNNYHQLYWNSDEDAGSRERSFGFGENEVVNQGGFGEYKCHERFGRVWQQQDSDWPASQQMPRKSFQPNLQCNTGDSNLNVHDTQFQPFQKKENVVSIPEVANEYLAAGILVKILPHIRMGKQQQFITGRIKRVISVQCGQKPLVKLQEGRQHIGFVQEVFDQQLEQWVDILNYKHNTNNQNELFLRQNQSNNESYHSLNKYAGKADGVRDEFKCGTSQFKNNFQLGQEYTKNQSTIKEKRALQANSQKESLQPLQDVHEKVVGKNQHNQYDDIFLTSQYDDINHSGGGRYDFKNGGNLNCVNQQNSFIAVEQFDCKESFLDNSEWSFQGSPGNFSRKVGSHFSNKAFNNFLKHTVESTVFFEGEKQTNVDLQKRKEFQHKQEYQSGQLASNNGFQNKIFTQPKVENSKQNQFTNISDKNNCKNYSTATATSNSYQILFEGNNNNNNNCSNNRENSQNNNKQENKLSDFAEFFNQLKIECCNKKGDNSVGSTDWGSDQGSRNSSNLVQPKNHPKLPRKFDPRN